MHAPTALGGRRAAALACAVALVAAPGCGGATGSGDGPDGERRGATTEARDGRTAGGAPAAGARSDGADLRAVTTRLLADHASLTAFMVNTALAEGLEDQRTEAAVLAVDQTARSFATVVAQRAGDERGGRALVHLRRLAGASIDYAKARAGEDATAEADAEQRLDAARAELGDVLGDQAVPRRLRTLSRDLQDATDAAVTGSGDFYDEVRRAVSRTVDISASAATGLAQAGEPLDASPTAPAANLRSRFTALLAAHVHLTAAAVGAGAAAGFDAPQYEAAAATLDRSSASVAGAFGEVYGPEAGARFLERWRRHVGLFITYATAQAARDREGATRALEDLDAWRRGFGTFLAGVVPPLTEGAATAQLEPHVTATTAAIRAVVRRSSRTFQRLQEASARTEPTAALLADGIARDLPDRFPAR